MKIDEIRIDEYARSMFAFDRLHPRWIESCAGYLRSVFGDRLDGAVFLDYAFGRGNWSLAALKAGAREVIAIDASQENVRRLRGYCLANGIDGVEIIHGNAVESPIDRRADVLWIYGILPTIEDCAGFLDAMSAMRRDNASHALLYSYDAFSLRQAIVGVGRKGVTYASEQAFGADSLLFSHSARLRARDDLTAPVANFHSRSELAGLAEKAGMVPERMVGSYSDWLSPGLPTQEFRPHHLLCRFTGQPADLGPEARPVEERDIAVIEACGDMLMATLTGDDRRKAAIGLFNNHFQAGNVSLKSQLVSDFLYLVHGLMRHGDPKRLVGDAAALFEAARAALLHVPHEFRDKTLGDTEIGRHLLEQAIRL